MKIIWQHPVIFSGSAAVPRIPRACGAAVLLGLALFAMAPSPLNAAQIELSSSLNPVGSGARAMGMGGAFIGVADDATAASWNPAGLVQLEKPELSVVYSYFRRSQDYHPSNFPEMNNKNAMDAHAVNYASAAYPFVLFNHNVVVSLNYQRLFEMNKQVNRTVTTATTLSNGTVIANTNHDSYAQQGQLYALSPAVAFQIMPGLYLGGTLNIWEPLFERNGWTYNHTTKGSTTRTLASGTVIASVSNFQWDKDIEFSGHNGHIGLLWNFWGGLTVGAVYKTPFEGHLKVKENFVSESGPTGSLTTSSTSTDSGMSLQMPAAYGLGLSYRHNDNLSLSLDLYRTEWSEFVLTDASGAATNPVYGDSLSNGRLADTTQVRLGMEYLLIRSDWVIPFRTGAFYDPEPARGRVDDYFGISVGTGYSGSRFSADIAYVYRFGSNVNGDIGVFQEKSADIRQHTLLTSLIWYF